MPVIPGDEDSQIKDATPQGVPAGQQVNDFHTNDDTDRSITSHHHTLGIGRNKATSGLHNHSGVDSRKIGAGMGLTITGKLSPTTVAEGDAVVDSLIAALKTVMDITDSRI